MNKFVMSLAMGAALACGTAFSQQDNPQGANDDGPGMSPPCGRQMGQGMRGGQRMGNGPRFGGRGGLEGCANPERLKEAGATADQIKAVSEVQFQQKAKRIDLQAAAEKAELALEQVMKGAGDEAAALKAADALNQARGELFKLDISTRVRTRQILGEEILKKLREQKPQAGSGLRGQGACGAGPNGDCPRGKGRKQ